jgi:Trypsin-like peptidase domain
MAARHPVRGPVTKVERTTHYGQLQLVNRLPLSARELTAADAVVMIVPNPEGADAPVLPLPVVSLRDYLTKRYGVAPCAEEAYLDELVVDSGSAVCTGFVLDRNGQRCIVSAGHCIGVDCEHRVSPPVFFVFNYLEAGSHRQVACSSRHARAKSVRVGAGRDRQDFAVVKFPRGSFPPLEILATPLKEATRSTPITQFPVYALGFPTGMPLTRSGPGPVTRHYAHGFVAEIPTFAGFSGAPVVRDELDAATGRIHVVVEGVMSAGPSNPSFSIDPVRGGVASLVLDLEKHGDTIYPGAYAFDIRKVETHIPVS